MTKMKTIPLLFAIFSMVSAAHALTWTTQIVDSDRDVGWNPTLMFDPHGNPWISYYDSTNEDLKIATWYDGKWTTETADSEGNVGAVSSLAFDDSGNPHIAYHDLTNHNLKFARKTSGTWQTETIDPTMNGGWSPSLSFDIEEEPFIFHLVVADHPLRAVARKNGSWIRMTEESLSGNFGGASYVYDENGLPHIGMIDVKKSSIVVIHYNKEGFSSETVDSVSKDPSQLSMAMGPGENLHISYGGDNSLMHAWQEGGVWRIEVVDQCSKDFPCGMGSSLAFDGAGNPHISYYYPLSRLLYHAWRDGGTWNHELVDGGGMHSSLAFDSDGNPLIAYDDVNDGTLKIAYATMNATEKPGTTSTIRPVTSEISTVTHASGGGLASALVGVASTCVISGISYSLLRRRTKR